MIENSIANACTKLVSERLPNVPLADLAQLEELFAAVTTSILNDYNSGAKDRTVYLVPPLPGAADLARRLAEAAPGSFLPLTHDEMAIALEILPWPSRTGSR